MRLKQHSSLVSLISFYIYSSLVSFLTFYGKKVQVVIVKWWKMVISYHYWYRNVRRLLWVMVGGIIFEVIRLVLWIKNTASAVRKAKWNIIDFLAVLVVDIKFYWTWFNMKELQYNKGEVDSLWETDTLAKKKKCSRYVEWGLYHMSHLCTFIFCGWSHSVDLDTTQD